MFSYYGSKTNLVDYYPGPKFNKIIEPFAGAAKYSLKYFEKDITIVDSYDVIIKIWKWLQICSKNDILKLPNPKYGDMLDDIKFDCEEARLLMGFIVGCGAERPRNKVGYRKTIDRPKHINYHKKRIADQLYKIRHWEIISGSYLDMQNKKATWFIDPPYQFGGHSYVESNKKIDFTKLSEWCRSRKGQIVVCENTKANWMNFKPIIQQKGSRFITTEAIWSNYPTNYDYQQQSLF